jgi:hypothetical protein
MSNFQKLGPTDEPLDRIQDAEFDEVPEPQRSRPDSPDAALDLSIAAWWREIPKAQKIIFFSIIGCVALLLLGNLHIENDAPQSPLTPAQIAAATDMAFVAGGDAATGQPAFLDDRSGDVGDDCGGKFIWSFNSGGTADTVALQDAAGASITSGKYTLAGGKLRLSQLVEKRNDGSTIPLGKPVKNVTYHIGRTADGRVIIGKKNYRQCTFTPADHPAAQPERPQPAQVDQHVAAQPAPQQGPVPVQPSTPKEVCEALEGDASRIVTERTQTSVPGFSIIEVNQIEKLARVDNGEASCTAMLTTNAGNLAIDYHTEKSPKGRSIIYVEVNTAISQQLETMGYLQKAQRELNQMRQK